MAETMTFDGDALHLLDQRALPGEVRYLACRTADETAQAIRSLVVRGAPAIGVAAAFGIALAAKRAMESGASLEGALEFGDRDRDRFQVAEDVREPEADEIDVLLTGGLQDEIAIFGGRAIVHAGRVATRGYGRVNLRQNNARANPPGRSA